MLRLITGRDVFLQGSRTYVARASTRSLIDYQRSRLGGMGIETDSCSTTTYHTLPRTLTIFRKIFPWNGTLDLDCQF